MDKLCASVAGLLLAACAAQPAVVFRCEGGAELRAVFEDGRVRLAFPGHRVELPRAISGSGARYSDGRLTFWNKGREAFVQRGDSIVYRACRQEERG
jgi:membrane-bound inhibitor of C-type lysozyme